MIARIQVTNQKFKRKFFLNALIKFQIKTEEPQIAGIPDVKNISEELDDILN